MNIEIGPDLLGWRAGLLALVVLLGVYMLRVVWRMRRVQRRLEAQAAPQEPSAVSAPKASAAYAAVADVAEEGNIPEPVTPAPPQESVDPAYVRRLERELLMLRDELDALRSEFSGLRDDLRREAEQLKAAQTVSPLYTDAMQMAKSGHGAVTIAERCGISRAEAELVVALVKSQS